MNPTTFERPPAAMLAYRVSFEAYAIEARIAALYDFLFDPEGSIGGATGWALIQNHANLDYDLLDQDVDGMQRAIDKRSPDVALMLAKRIQAILNPPRRPEHEA